MLLSLRDYENLNNAFIGSEKLLRMFSLFRYFLGDELYQDAIIGQGNWLVFATDVSLDDYQNVWALSESQTNKIKKKIFGLNDYLTSKGIKLIIIIPPNKNTIYPEYMPKEIPVIGKRSRYDQVNDLLIMEDSLGYIDLREVLLRERDNRLVYYATDTHWNPHGVYFAYEAIMNEINEDYPEIEPHSLEDYLYVRTPNRDGDVALRLINIYIQETFYQLRPKDKYQFEYREICARHREYIVPGLEAPKLLVIHDSFGAGLIPFLREHFSHSIFIHDDSVDPFLIESVDPDIVIIEWTERELIRLLYLPDF